VTTHVLSAVFSLTLLVCIWRDKYTASYLAAELKLSKIIYFVFINQDSLRRW